MLLVARFYGLRFPMGVRVGGVMDQPDRCEGRSVHRFAWYYDTLQDHLERGRMRYELRKWTDTGQVEVRIDAYSQRGDVPNPLVGLGACRVRSLDAAPLPRRRGVPTARDRGHGRGLLTLLVSARALACAVHDDEQGPQ